eukprot:973070-Amphidinium_carterae.1
MRKQHARLSDPLVVQFVAAAIESLGPLEPVSSLSLAAFRRRWDAVLSVLLVPRSLAHYPTPGCLRGSGATHFYMLTEDLPRLQWRGRWRRLQTLEFYLQECAAHTFLQDLSLESQTHIFSVASLAD